MRMKLRRSLSIILIAAVLFVNFSSASTAYASEVDAAGEEQITESIDAADANDAAAIDAESEADMAEETEAAGAKVLESSRQSNGHTEKEEVAEEAASDEADGITEAEGIAEAAGAALEETPADSSEDSKPAAEAADESAAEENAPAEGAAANDAADGKAAEEGTPTEGPSAGDTSTESAPEMEIPQVIVEVPEIPDEKSSEKKDAAEDEITFKDFTLVLARIGDWGGAYPAEFEIELWSEEDGNKVPFANLELPSGQTLDENGKAKVSVELTETSVHETLQVPDNAHYKVTLSPAVTENAACVWQSGEKADDGVTGDVRWTSSVVCYAHELFAVKTSKEDKNGTLLEGAKLQILDDKGNVLDSWTSGSEVHVTKLLPTISSNPQYYILHEESAPEGYAKAQDIQFRVFSGWGVVYNGTEYADFTIHMVDEKLPGSLTVEMDFDTLDGIVLKDTNFAAFNIKIEFEGLTQNKAYRQTYTYGEYEAERILWLGPDNSSVTFQLHSYDHATIEGLPEGVTYTVTEVMEAYHTQRYDSEPVYDEYRTGTIESDKESKTIITNKANVYTWSLTKQVVGAYDDQVFEFYFYFVDDFFQYGDTPHYYYINDERYELEVLGHEHGAGGTIDRTELGARVYIKAGDTITVPNIAAGHHYYYAEGDRPFGYEGYTSSSGGLYWDYKVLAINKSRMVGIRKLDQFGKHVTGAKMQILGHDHETVIEEFITTDEDYFWFPKYNINDGSNQFYLHEEAAPDGYLISEEDIPFTFEVGERVEYTRTAYGNYKDISYYEPYIVTVNGEVQEDNFLVMTDKATEVTVQKTDITGSKEIAGASLAVYKAEDVVDGEPKSDAKPVDSWVSEEDTSHVITGKLAAGGDYVLIETMAPEGYEIATAVPFTVNEDGTPSTVQMKDEYSLRSVHVSKVDVADGAEVENAHIQILDSAGAVFTEWDSTTEPHLVEGLTVGEEYTLHETVAPEGYLITSDTTFTIAGDGKITTTGKSTTDEEGNTILLVEDTKTSVRVSKVDIADGAEVPDAHIQVIDSEGGIFAEWVSTDEPHVVEGLKVGEVYTLKETVAPDGYTIASEITFTIDENGEVTTRAKTTTDEDGNTVILVEDAKTSIRVSKVDITGDEELEGAVIQILDSNGDEVEKWTSTTEPHVIEGLLVGEEYTLKEITAPDGYTITSEITFTVDENNEITTGAKTTTDEDGNTVILIEDAKTYVSVSKTDITGDEELEGAVIQILDSKGGEVEKWTSTTTPHVIEGLLVGEEYTLKEITAPDGYTITAETTFTIDADGKVTTTGSSTTDEDGHPVLLIKDTKTRIEVSKGDITSGEELEGAVIQILDSKGDEVEKWTSTKEPHVVEGLKTGEEYTLKETVAPDGYTIAAETTFTIDENGKVKSETTKISDGVLLVEDAKTHVEVSKVDIADGKEVEGAHIQIIDGEGKVVDEWDSTTEPHVIEGLKTGVEYTLKETVAPEGYLVTTDITFTIETTGEVTTRARTTTDEEGHTIILVEDTKTSVSVSKVDIADGEEVEGAHIQILDSDGKVVEEWDSTTEPHTIEGLKTGEEYTLRETVAPEGYSITTDTTFTIDEDGKVTSTGTVTEDGILLVEDAKQNLKVSKVDIADGEEVEGAHIQILDKDGNVVEEWDSTTEPHLIGSLKVGEEYTLRETVAPEGYLVTSDTTFTIDKEGKVTTTGSSTTDEEGNTILLVEDTKTHVEVSKVDIVDGEELEGAHIQILDKDGNVVEEWDSTTEPHVIEGLKTGEEYTLRETVAPEGYMVTTDTTFTIDENGKVTSTGSTTTDQDGHTILLVEDAREGETAITIGGKKVLEGGTLKAGQFTFVLTDENGKSIGEAKNDADGNFSFGKLAYRTSDLGGEKSKVFTYKISETKGSDSTITYDETVITVKVTVTDEGDGKLTAAADKAASEIKFVNKVKEKKIDNNTNRPSSSAGSKKGSRTGDEAPLGILFGGLGIGAAGLIALLAVRRRRKADE